MFQIMASQNPRHTLCPKLGLARTSATRLSTRLATTPSTRTEKFGSRDKKGEKQSEARHRDSLCHLCSKEGAVYHPHFSTQCMRGCKNEKALDLTQNITRRLILCDSILYNVWKSPALNVAQHVDMEAIVGGRVRDLTRALQQIYLSKPHRLEIIAMVSINNIGEGQTPEKIIQEMKNMKELVKGHSIYYEHDPPSYVSFATCILPPKFCSFSVPKDVPDLAQWIPSPNFNNMADQIKALNILIKEMNKKDSLQYVGLHLLGMKYFKSGTKQHKFDTGKGAKQIWRETEVFRKLHFTLEIKTKIVGSALNCFNQNANCQR